MKSKHCAACGQIFYPRPQVPLQNYCAAPACQRERRRRWQEKKRQSDPDYQDNQSRAQQAWCKQHPDYWREYRITHPEYMKRNRTQQRERNEQARASSIAKMDASAPIFRLQSGIYRIAGVASAGIAKKNAWIVEITLVSETYR
ncbi:hypothetical protein [Collimonas pratensis]|uniref:hypothetical protein n=1 Tax=Collimonas pratensis TaxID=279113 RepID=UPI0009EDCF89|nr:hypothetical protein [Collimonas pratensis]